jgi:fucose 4-O-acetylase-like acetyltransferase
VAVIIGHLPGGVHGVHPFGALPEWIYYIHIPLFMAVSCLFVSRFTWRKTGSRALRILVPYGIWFALSHPWRLLFAPAGLLGDGLMGNWTHLQSILWFLPALFTANVAMALWRRLESRGLWVRVLLDAGTMQLSLFAFLFAREVARLHDRIPFGLDVVIFLLPFLLAMGRVWRLRPALARLGGALAPLALLALGLGWALVRFCEDLKCHGGFQRRVDFAQFTVPERLPGYLGMLLMGAALLLLADRIPFRRLWAALGRFSMPIYLLHYPLLVALRHATGLAGDSRLALLAIGMALTALAAAGPALFAGLLSRGFPWSVHLGFPPWKGLGLGSKG